MGISSALNTGLSGLAANQSELDVVGNNIANANTLAFKSSRLDFKSQFSETFSYGSAPNGNLGGTNPIQVGLGVQQGSMTRMFTEGSTELTGVDSNLAIQGDGFFVLDNNGTQNYTRDGSFKLSSSNDLVNADGLHVEGYGVDKNFNLIPGTLQNINIPVGQLTIAQPTQTLSVATGNLNASGALPTAVAQYNLGAPLYASNGSGGTTGVAPTASTPLTSLVDSTGAAYFSPTDVLSFSASVGGQSIQTQTLPVTSGAGVATLGDLMNFLSGSLGINTSAGANGSVATPPGASLASIASGAAAQLQIAGNVGVKNDFLLDGSGNSLTGATGPAAAQLAFSRTSTANGESTSAGAALNDSLGNSFNSTTTISLISKNASGGTVWQYYVTSPGNTPTGANTQTAIGTGTITFDANGNFVSATPTTVTVDRTGTGASPNLTFNIDFSKLNGQGNQSSGLNMTADGLAAGTLHGYSIDSNGIIKGNFSPNGAVKILGQIALATFRNNQGLVDKGSNLFAEGSNSGTAQITAPGQGTAGTIQSDALEGSNVDLSTEFVRLISASTGFSAASRVITTSNQLLQELLSAAR
jgi:flagellar hook protein FlgE